MLHPFLEGLQVLRRGDLAFGEQKVVVKTIVDGRSNGKLYPRVMLEDRGGKEMRQSVADGIEIVIGHMAYMGDVNNENALVNA